METNPYETAARIRKANILATGLEALHCLPGEVTYFKGWDTLASVCQVHIPSDTTKLMVQDIMYERATIRMRLCSPVPA